MRPVSTCPCASFSTTVAVALPPPTTAVGARETDTLATGAAVGWFTVSVAMPFCPSLVAMIVTVPAATAVTAPEADTVASEGAEELHVTVRPVSTFPSAS